MKVKNQNIVLFISLTILATIGLQLYWNLKNHQEKKLQLVREVQAALDNSIEYYYVDYMKDNIVAYVNHDNSMNSDEFMESIKTDSFFRKAPFVRAKKKLKKPAQGPGSITTSSFVNIKINADAHTSKKTLDSIGKALHDSLSLTDQPLEKTKISLNAIQPSDIRSISVVHGKKSTDSVMALKTLANKIVLSVMQDSINLKALATAFQKELKRKNIGIDFQIRQLRNDNAFNVYPVKAQAGLTLNSLSKSSYLPKNETIKVFFSNPTLLVLKRSMTEILLSLLLSLSIISCLLFLLKTINSQKRVDTIKNDLISNITHEFKTPITTIATAIEGLKNFNAENDKEKTQRYLSISGQQLSKLELMVERLLETATLKTDQLMLRKEPTDLNQILLHCVEKHQLSNPSKKLVFHTETPQLFATVDAFHFENVVSNLIDNAVKYGGNEIAVTSKKENGQWVILVADNGKMIEKIHRDKIFEQFYRIPKGNLHDVKGFGIGLYYAKKIIEKHQGRLSLLGDSKTTTFKIMLPHGT